MHTGRMPTSVLKKKLNTNQQGRLSTSSKGNPKQPKQQQQRKKFVQPTETQQRGIQSGAMVVDPLAASATKPGVPRKSTGQIGVRASQISTHAEYQANATSSAPVCPTPMMAIWRVPESSYNAADESEGIRRDVRGEFQRIKKVEFVFQNVSESEIEIRTNTPKTQSIDGTVDGTVDTRLGVVKKTILPDGRMKYVPHQGKRGNYYDISSLFPNSNAPDETRFDRWINLADVHFIRPNTGASDVAIPADKIMVNINFTVTWIDTDQKSIGAVVYSAPEFSLVPYTTIEGMYMTQPRHNNGVNPSGYVGRESRMARTGDTAQFLQLNSNDHEVVGIVIEEDNRSPNPPAGIDSGKGVYAYLAGKSSAGGWEPIRINAYETDGFMITIPGAMLSLQADVHDEHHKHFDTNMNNLYFKFDSAVDRWVAWDYVQNSHSTYPPYNGPDDDSDGFLQRLLRGSLPRDKVHYDYFLFTRRSHCIGPMGMSAIVHNLTPTREGNRMMVRGLDKLMPTRDIDFAHTGTMQERMNVKFPESMDKIFTKRVAKIIEDRDGEAYSDFLANAAELATIAAFFAMI